MKQKFTTRFLQLVFIYLFYSNASLSQNSVLVNFGSNSCSPASATAPAFSLIKNPLSGSATLIASCDLSAQEPDFFTVFIAYNPKNNKIYLADNRSGINTKIWILDIGLPLNMSCPLTIPALPTYSYPYISNNFEFDNNGDLWSLSNYNNSTGQCNLDKFDVVTGNIINTRVLQFPAGNFPTTISSGDLTILPNGRMFASLGSGICRLYEITNYSSTTGNTSANYLQTLPRDCYGIAYLNGQLELTGTNFSGTCYYYDYSIASNTLGTEKTFQAGQSPIDNTSFTPAVGVTKQLIQSVKKNKKTADITYDIYVKNMGNVILNNINVTDNLGAIFGAGNISRVRTNFVAGANIPGLTLNPQYNGITNTNLLNPGQNLANQTSAVADYFFRIQVKCRVTRLRSNTTYLNSAIGTATIGNSISLINVSDSSNNGPSTVVDPNNDGNAGGIGENVPTPFTWNLGHGGHGHGDCCCGKSTDGSHANDQKTLLNDKAGKPIFTVFPNPASNFIEINATGIIADKKTIELYDEFGRKLLTRQMSGASLRMDVSRVLNGTYFLKIMYNDEVIIKKLLVVH